MNLPYLLEYRRSLKDGTSTIVCPVCLDRQAEDKAFYFHLWTKHRTFKTLLMRAGIV